MNVHEAVPMLTSCVELVPRSVSFMYRELMSTLHVPNCAALDLAVINYRCSTSVEHHNGKTLRALSEFKACFNVWQKGKCVEQ